MGTGELLGKPNKLRGSDLRWTSIPSRGSRNTPSRFMLQNRDKLRSYMYEPVLAPRLHTFLCYLVLQPLLVHVHVVYQRF